MPPPLNEAGYNIHLSDQRGLILQFVPARNDLSSFLNETQVNWNMIYRRSNGNKGWKYP